MEKRRDKTNSSLLIVDGKKKEKWATIMNSLIEYLSLEGYQVSVENSQSKSYVNLPQLSNNYQIIDKKGYKSFFIYLKEVDSVLIPNTQLLITWFSSLSKLQQKKVWFLIDRQQIENNDQEKSEKNSKQLKLQKRITFELNADLVARAENFLEKQWEQDNYTYSSLSELIRTSLRAYQQGKLRLPKWREKHAPKRGVNIRLSGDLVNFYLSLPQGRRINFVEGALLAYLDRV